MTKSALKELQLRYQNRIDNQLEKALTQLPSTSHQLKDAMGYCLFNGGKRVRPFLVYGFGEMLDIPLSQLDPCAVAIECIHAYSLVHDDLPAMDDDNLRRGKPTCHIQYDEATAILVGDALQSLAFEAIADAKEVPPETQVKWVKTLAQAAGLAGMCGGQALDMESTDRDISLDSLEQLHRLKTGALIEATAKMVTAAKTELNIDEIEQVNIFAKSLGLAFQVQDDILDVIGDTQALGKVQGTDQSQNKSTYPKLLGLAGAQALAQQLHSQATSALQQLPYNSATMCAFAEYIVARNH